MILKAPIAAKFNMAAKRKKASAISFESDKIQRQTCRLFHVFWLLETHWNSYLYDWIHLDFQDGDYQKICFTITFESSGNIGVY